MATTFFKLFSSFNVKSKHKADQSYNLHWHFKVLVKWVNVSFFFLITFTLHSVRWKSRSDYKKLFTLRRLGNFKANTETRINQDDVRDGTSSKFMLGL